MGIRLGRPRSQTGGADGSVLIWQGSAAVSQASRNAATGPSDTVALRNLAIRTLPGERVAAQREADRALPLESYGRIGGYQFHQAINVARDGAAAPPGEVSPECERPRKTGRNRPRSLAKAF